VERKRPFSRPRVRTRTGFDEVAASNSEPTQSETGQMRKPHRAINDQGRQGNSREAADQDSLASPTVWDVVKDRLRQRARNRCRSVERRDRGPVGEVERPKAGWRPYSGIEICSRSTDRMDTNQRSPCIDFDDEWVESRWIRRRRESQQLELGQLSFGLCGHDKLVRIPQETDRPLLSRQVG